MNSLDVLVNTEDELEEWLPSGNQVLLIELPLRNREAVRKAIKEYIKTGGRLSFSELGNVFPLTFTRWLVGEATDEYQEGSLWPQIAKLLEVPVAWTNECGKAFHRAVQHLHLRTFEEGNYYVTTVLGHGAVPVKDLPTLFRLAKDASHRLTESATGEQIRMEIVQSTAFAYQPKPIQRFLRTGPRVFVGEYLLEMVDILARGLRAGQRPILQQGFRVFEVGSRRPSRTKVAPDKPYLRVGLEPQDTAPLVLMLPSRQTTAKEWPWAIATNLGSFPLDDYPGELQVNGTYKHDLMEVNIESPITSIEVRFEGRVVLQNNISATVAPFMEDYVFHEKPWLRAGDIYFLLLAPDSDLFNKEVLRMNESPYFGSWAGYKLCEIEAQCPRVSWGGENAGSLPVVAPPRVQHSITAMPSRPAEVRIYGFPVDNDLITDSDPFKVKLSGGTWIILTSDEVSHESDYVTVDVSRALTTLGEYRLLLEGPFGTSGQVRVDFGPVITLEVPDTLRWPDSVTGQHRMGKLGLTIPSGTTVDIQEEWRLEGKMAERQEIFVTCHDSRLALTVRYAGESYDREWRFRAIWWEWSASHCPQIINQALRVTWEQFTHYDWQLSWHESDKIHLEFLVTDSRERCLKNLGALRPDHPHSLLHLIQDEISHATGDSFGIVGRVVRDGMTVARFPLAMIDRPLIQHVGVTRLPESQRLVVNWDGPTVSGLNGTVQSLWRSFSPMRFRSDGVPQRSRNYRATLRGPLKPGLLGITLDGGAISTLRVLGRIETSDPREFDQGFLNELSNWIDGKSSAPIPRRSLEYLQWVECLAFVAPGEAARAVGQVVLPYFHKQASYWVTAALGSWEPRAAMFKLGVAQWDIQGTVGYQDSPQLVQVIPSIKLTSPILAWLVGNGCWHFDVPTATQILGPRGPLVAETQACGEITTQARRTILETLKSGLDESPPGHSLDLPISPGDEAWVREEIGYLCGNNSLMGRVVDWVGHCLPNDEALISMVAMLQRAAARGLYTLNPVRVLQVAVGLPSSWDSVYERELLRADLLMILAEEIEMRRQA